MTTILQNDELLKELVQLLRTQRALFRQERVYQRVALLLVAELVVFARHTVTQLLMSVCWTQRDWSSWYRLFSHGRFPYDGVSVLLLGETLPHVGTDKLYVVAGDGTPTRRSSRKMEGTHWLHNPQSPVFKRGIHIAQRWSNGSWLLPTEDGYSHALPLRWLPAFTEKSRPKATAPRKEWQAALVFLLWVRQQLAAHGRAAQQVLMVTSTPSTCGSTYQRASFCWHAAPKTACCGRCQHPARARTVSTANGIRHPPPSGVNARDGAPCNSRCAAAHAICR